jgi:AcrR family transcriptional regulator
VTTIRAVSEPSTPAGPPSRVERRKARTRAALIAAAQRFFAEQGGTDASIQDITDAADVGFGSFYNYFSTKSELFEVALEEAFETLASRIAEQLSGFDDPAVVFASSLRVSGRLHYTHPQLARVLMHATGRMMLSPMGLAAHAFNDIVAAQRAGRFTAMTPEVAVACAAGALVATLQLFDQVPDADVDGLTDEMAAGVLRMFGMSVEEAARIVAMPLPDPPAAP